MHRFGRKLVRVVVIVIASVVTLACASGGSGTSPAGFSSGERWTFPLVGPLENDLLITALTVRGHGPYLFAIDPDASITVVDEEVVEDAGLVISEGPVRIDENGAPQVRGYTELVDVKLGDLNIGRRAVMVVPANFYDTRGRHLNGVLGRDVIRPSLVFGFDRDRGVATLTTAGAFSPPEGAVTIEAAATQADALYTQVTRRGVVDSSGREEASPGGVAARLKEAGDLDVAPGSRHVAAAQLGDTKLAMHLDLGSSVSQVRSTLWDKLSLTPGDVSLRLVDEAASVRRVHEAGIATAVAVGDARAEQITVVPYIDRRYPEQLDGALGLDFFSAYSVHAHWERGAFYLKPRGNAVAATATRLARWGAALPSCPRRGCITTKVNATDTGLQLEIVRDPEAINHSFEVYLGVIPAPGKSPLPLAINLPKGIDKISGGLPLDYEGAALIVLDVSPFARECEGSGGCVFALNPRPARE